MEPAYERRENRRRRRVPCRLVRAAMEPAYERRENLQGGGVGGDLAGVAAMEPAYERRENSSWDSSHVTWADGAWCERSLEA